MEQFEIQEKMIQEMMIGNRKEAGNGHINQQAFDYFPVFIYQELCKIPVDKIKKEQVGKMPGQILDINLPNPDYSRDCNQKAYD